MKFINMNAVKSKFSNVALILTIFYTSTLAHDTSASAPGPELKKNQLKAYANTYEAPTMTGQIPLSNYIAPKLSAALRESDPTKKLRKSDFIETIKYAFYKLTRGELEQIFNFADQNKDDMVDQKEWDDFSSLFILPFEACDKNQNNLLEEEEWKACYDADPKSKLVEFRRRYIPCRHRLMIDIVTTRGSPELNFSDYLFIRKALFGWSYCHSNAKYIARSHFKCALEASIPQKYYSLPNFEEIYNTGLKIATDRNLIELDFINYLRIMYFTYVFGVLNLAGDTANLEKAHWLKAVKEDRLPNNFEESEIELIYSLINNSPEIKLNVVDHIEFYSWSFFFHLHRLFNQYSMRKPLQLNLEEFLKMLENPFMNKEVLMAMDISSTKFLEQHYQEASLILQRERLNERDFFFSRFKQDVSLRTPSLYNVSTTNATYYEIKPNVTNREVFFTTMTDINKKYWLKSNMYRGFQLANLYLELTDYRQETASRTVSATVFVEKLKTYYDLVKPHINMLQRTNFELYKIFPREIHIDLLTFLALENYFAKFRIEKLSSTTTIDETTAKIILNDFGMHNMPDTVLDVASRGYDLLHRRKYAPFELARVTLLVHSIASENMRNRLSVNTHNVKTNNDSSRNYPDSPRRFMSSDKV